MNGVSNRLSPDAASLRQRIEQASARLVLRREQSAAHARACMVSLRRPAVLPLVALAAAGLGFVVGRMRRARTTLPKAAPPAVPPSLMVLGVNAIMLASAALAFMKPDRNPRSGA